MSSWTEQLDRAAGAATCAILRDTGSTLTGIGTWSLWTGKPGLTAFGLGAAAQLAANSACPDGWDPNGVPTVPTDDKYIRSGSCLETDGPGLNIKDKDGSSYIPGVQKLVSVVPTGSYPNGTPKVTVTYVDAEGLTRQDDESASRAPFSTELVDGYTCGGDVAPDAEPDIPDYEYTDPETGCEITVKVEGFGVGDDGVGAPVFRIEPSPSTKRNGGGVIGGCNFEPTIYYLPPGGGGGDGGGGGGGPIVIPGPPPGVDPFGNPEWLRLLKDALAGVAANLIADAVTSLFEQPYEKTVYKVRSVCEADDEGIQKQTVVPIPEAKGLEAVLFRLDAVAELLQPLKDYKQPICPIEKPELLGDWRTISFISDETSPEGKSRLRKRFRYRSESGADLGSVVDHWKDFTFNAGPVCVQHSGHTWGTPQVWAASVDEGKRVIQHAGGEAGIDPDQVGKWTVSGSDNPRFGMPGRMRVNRSGGYYWITARLGSNNRPEVAVT